jgi:hypothetical protein
MIDHHQPVGAGLCNLISIVPEIYAKPALPHKQIKTALSETYHRLESYRYFGKRML